MTNTTPTATRTQRDARLKWVAIADMRVSPLAQRELKQYWVDRIAADLDPEELGNPTVNLRDGHWYIIDGQHRVEAMRQIGWGDQQIQCWTYEGLTEEQEAEKFLRLNNKLTIATFDEFKVALRAGRPEQVEINRVILANGLCISNQKVPGAIGAVATLERVWRRTDSATLGRTVRIIRDAYGDAGLEAAVIDGIGYVCGRYNGELDESTAVLKLSAAHGGVGGLLNKAALIRNQTGQAKGQCVAAAAVEIINSGKGGKKLPNWWN